MYQLIGMALAGVIGLGLLAQVLPETARLSSQQNANYAATQLYTFTKAAEEYVNNNHATLLTATAGGVQAVTAPMIVAEGSLDAAFTDTNTFNQTHRLLIRQPSSGTLQALVATCGGNAINANELARLSQLAGPEAGLISPLDPNNALGAGGHWTMALSNYAHLSCPLTVGHMTALVTPADAGSVSPYLHRNAHPNPDANTMFTDLLLDGNSLVDAGNIDVNTINNLSGNVRVNDALEVTGGLSNPSGNLRVNDALEVTGGLSNPSGNLRINDTLEVTGAISNPSGNVVFNDVVDLQNDLYMDRFFDRQNTGFYVDPASVSVLNDLQATILRDRDNTGYYLDLNNTSNANHLNAQRLYSHGETYSRNYRPTTLYAENAGCSETYAIGVSTANNVVICKGGTWQKVGGSSLTAALTSVPVNTNYGIATDGFVYVQGNVGCTYSYQSITINGALRGSLKAYAPGGSLSYGTFPVRAGDTINVTNTFGCAPSFIYYQRYG